MKLDDVRNAYISEGVSYLEAGSRTCQDVILALIAKSPLSKNISVKGGVVMRHISGDSRRATQDLDLDLIKYPIRDDAIVSFIEKLNRQDESISISITSPIVELKHQDYNGKRVYIRITDIEGTCIDTKLDIGVHKGMMPEQKSYCFDLGKLDDSVTLLVNTKEQIFVEKLKSLLRLGAVSTRYKDVFDMYYLCTQSSIDKDSLMVNFNTLIFEDKTMRENSVKDISDRLESIFNNQRFIRALSMSKRHNWLEIDPVQAVRQLVDYVKSF